MDLLRWSLLFLLRFVVCAAWLGGCLVKRPINLEGGFIMADKVLYAVVRA